MAASILGTFLDGIDGHLLTADDNLHVDIGQRRLGVSWVEQDEVTPTNEGATWGGTFIFEPSLGPDFLGELQLQYTVAAFASASATAPTYPRHSDYFGFISIDTVSVKFGSNTLQELEGEDLYVLHNFHKGIDEKLDAAVLGGLQLNIAQRYVNGIASNDLIVPLPLFWTWSFATFLPYGLTMLSSKMQIRVKMAANSAVVETDGTDITGGALSDVRLSINAHYMNDLVQEQIFAERKTMASDSPLGVDGYARMVPVMRRQKGSAITTATAQQNVKISSIREPADYLVAGIRATSDIPSGITGTRDQFNFVQPSERTIKSQNTTLRISKSGAYLKDYLHSQHFTSAPSSNLVIDSFSYSPESFTSQMGYIQTNGFSDLKYFFTNSSAVTGQIDLWALGKSIYSVGKNSELVMLFT